MNKRLLWTTAVLTTALGIPLAGYAESTKEVNSLRVNRQANSPQTVPTVQPTNVVKVGEYQSSAGNKANTVIARIQPHQLAGHPAATLYVRNIPVLTFLGVNPVATSSTKVGTTGDDRSATRSAQTKVATIGNLPDLNKQVSAGTDNDNFQASNTPVWRATAVAAKINQLNLDNVDASKITVTWKAGGASATKTLGNSPKKTLSDRYLIKVNGEELVEINGETRLPDKTNDLAEDALQATNRLRRLLGNAPPLREVSGKPVPRPKQMSRPKLPQQISLGSVRIRLSGMASWYGPGFHGNRSASGERYNQNALTAAHRSLPFGTKVRVTNIRSGRSVVVRINDRGPHIRGRIIDLSAAAARIVGVMQSGVAPVRVEVLSNQRPASASANR
jgi:rare lipoprotein A